ncbi:MAG: hypothetical protein ABR521_14775 [Gaiellaceae bacterium]
MRDGVSTLLLYLAAGVVYVVTGVLFVEFMFTSVVAIAYLLLAVWLLPATVRRLRR